MSDVQTGTVITNVPAPKRFMITLGTYLAATALSFARMEET